MCMQIVLCMRMFVIMCLLMYSFCFLCALARVPVLPAHHDKVPLLVVLGASTSERQTCFGLLHDVLTSRVTAK